ncbi:MAG TPA: CvpA family protein, partial [Isosphaeraceae bacterium]
MGLDILLGLVILAAAVRGWFRGFVLQAIRLGGLVGAVYSAAPIRDAARPYVNEYLPSIRP